MPSSPLHAPVLDWYAGHARDLPWRSPGTSAWAVLVSEVMLQQTPVARVEPVYRAWLARWPTPAALAAEPPGEAVRAWGRLGYPRRALRLHAAATEVVDAARRRAADDVRRAGRAARGRGVHRGGRGVVRPRCPARRPGHQRAPGAGPDGRRRRAAGAHAHGCRAGPCRVGRARRPGHRGPLGGRRDGARGAGVHGSSARLRPVPGGRPVRVAAGGLPGVRRAGAAHPDLRRDRPAGARAADGRAAGPAGTCGTPRSSRRSGRSRCSATGPWPAWSPTVSSSRTPAATASPGTTPDSAPSEGHAPRSLCPPREFTALSTVDHVT